MKLAKINRYDADSSAGAEFMKIEPDLHPVSLGPVNAHGKRRQYVSAPVVPLAAPVAPVPEVGQCPGKSKISKSGQFGDILKVSGPYFCCPVWSTYGAAWRPATPFYNYVPPPPPNWNPVLRSAVGNWPSAAVGLPPFHRSRKPARLGINNEGPPPEQLRHMIGVLNDWIQRENGHGQETDLASSGSEPTQS
ncbi:hypothetical protein M3Y97_00611300 [Aphelenchoides bicaudatus]|nr:hypothetical protein M3Y97_00611300 [Aphelenchoides bicaudatus]